MIALPTIPASQAAELASRFAQTLTEKLDDINRQFPAANLCPDFEDIVAQAHAGTLLGPTPADAIPTFKRLFLALIASRYVIVANQP